MGKEIDSILKKAVQKSDLEVNNKMMDVLNIRQVDIINKNNSEDRTGYDKIKSNNFYTIKEDVLDWSNKDFALYISKKFSDKYFEYWDVRIMGVTTYMGRIKESLFEAIGFCDNITLKNYIDFFFDNHIDNIKNETGGKFYLKSLRRSYIIEEFLESYKYSPSINEKQFIKDKKDLTELDLEKSYLVGNETMVLKYGVVLPINYLVIKKEYSMEKAVDVIRSAVRNIKNVSGLDVIIKRTHDFSPYSDKLPFNNMSEIISILGKSDFSEDKLFKSVKTYKFLGS